VVHLGIPVTSPSRTIHDIAPRLSDQRLARTVDDAIHSGYLTESALAQQLHGNPQRAGTTRIVALLSKSDGPSRSDWERAFPAFCRRHGLPRPQMNVIVCGYEVDALFPGEKLIVELDGWAFHASRAAFERDRNRDADTLRAGYATVRITWNRFTGAAVSEGERLGAILAARRST
jgi:very-short-patch-repair endonuclease